MQTRSFATSTRFLASFTLGMLFLQLFWDSIAGEEENKALQNTDNNNTTEILVSTTGILLTTFAANLLQQPIYVTNAVNQTHSIEPMITPATFNKMVVIHAKTANPATQHFYMTQVLAHIYNNSAENRCNLKVLLETDFTVEVVPRAVFNVMQPDIYAFADYDVKKNCISVPEGFNSQPTKLLVQHIANCLTHAINVNDNRLAGRWPRISRGKNFTDSLFWGNPKDVRPDENYDTERADFERVTENVFNKDIRIILNLYTAINKHKKLTLAQHQLYDELAKEVIAAKYEPIVDMMESAEIIQEITTYDQKKIKPYHFLADKNRYVPRGNLFTWRDEERAYYVVEYSIKPKPIVLITCTHPEAKKPVDLVNDLLFNINQRVERGLEQCEDAPQLIPSVTLANLNAILTPYPKLKKILFPTVLAHQIERAEGVHKECLQESLSDDITQGMRNRMM